MPAVVTITGSSGSGTTTFVEQVPPELFADHVRFHAREPRPTAAAPR